MPNLTGVTKFFPRAIEGFTTTLASNAASGAGTVFLQSITGPNGVSYSNGDVVVLAVDPGNSTKQVFTGTIQSSDNSVRNVHWTEGNNVQHNGGATVVDYVTATDFDMMATGIQKFADQGGQFTGYGQYNVMATAYGAIGDGVADDSAAIQAAFTAATANGGGQVVFPANKTFKIVTTIQIDPSGLTSPILVTGYGAIISYTGSSDCFVIKTNIAASDVQHAERSVHWEGMHVLGTVSATSAFRVKATFCNFHNIVIENFTNVTSQTAAIILDGLYHFWVEECRFDGIEIKNTGNGICFISRDEVAGTPASLENNYFESVHIWCAVAAGKGVYGVGLGASTICLMARCSFIGIVVHIVNVANVNAFDFTLCGVEGVVLISPSIDVFNTATNSKGFVYTYGTVLAILGPTNYPQASVTTMYSGGGSYFIVGGNGNTGAPSTLRADAIGNLTAPTLTLNGDVYDTNGNKIIELQASASAVNRAVIQNSATAAAPTIKTSGADANIALNLAPKGVAGIVILDNNFNEVAIFGPAVASAVNETTFRNAATGNAPGHAATGNDTNIDYQIDGKGTGKVILGNASTGNINSVRQLNVMSATATPAGGTNGAGLTLGTTANLGVFFGSGLPTLSAAQGSLYIRTDGSSTSTRMYVNTNGTTGWTNVTTAT